jgi:preprotein translocase subunit SecA
MPVARTFTGPAAPEGDAAPVVRREVAGGMVAPDAAVRRPAAAAVPAGIGPSASQQAATLRAAGIAPGGRGGAGGGSTGPGGVARVGRNDPCPCGSGKKYKKCHGAGG